MVGAGRLLAYTEGDAVRVCAMPALRCSAAKVPGRFGATALSPDGSRLLTFRKSAGHVYATEVDVERDSYRDLWRIS